MFIWGEHSHGIVIQGANCKSFHKHSCPLPNNSSMLKRSPSIDSKKNKKNPHHLPPKIPSQAASRLVLSAGPYAVLQILSIKRWLETWLCMQKPLVVWSPCENKEKYRAAIITNNSKNGTPINQKQNLGNTKMYPIEPLLSVEFWIIISCTVKKR